MARSRNRTQTEGLTVEKHKSDCPRGELQRFGDIKKEIQNDFVGGGAEVSRHE